MASNPPAPAAPFVPSTQPFGFGPGNDEGQWEEWNPTEESLRTVRGRHRVSRQRGGGLARSSTVLGVGVIAAVGAGGMASANTGKPPVSISLPDLASVAHVFDGGSSAPKGSATALSDVGVSTKDAAQGAKGAGEALRDRIMAQAEVQRVQIDSKAQYATEAAFAQQVGQAAAQAEKDAAAQAQAAKDKAQAAAQKAAEAVKLAKLATQYTLPVVSYTITGTFGQAGSMWSSGYHTGLDFAAPTGTLIKAIHSGTITEAGWAGAYGYRTILTLDDGTELWFCHQSSINVSVGQKVGTGDVIGRIGATGNVTGPHLHLEVHPDGQATGIDPAPWLRGKGLNP
ncbi:M23 family metallopeptidase [Streptomyces sp. NPDC101152]|uniref:M23 family metallopeptidase n=1 Tax=Streptomyces sp. NPDC101152 TaxID=3366116 RepID=UPI00382EE239